MRKKTTILCEEEAIIDFIESELPSSQNEVIEILINNSLTHRRIWQSYQNLKKNLSAMKSQELPENGDYYEHQQQKIMQSLKMKKRKVSKDLTRKVQLGHSLNLVK